MTEILFILTTIYVAYVVFKVVDSAKVETQDTYASDVATIITANDLAPTTQATVAPAVEPVPSTEAVAASELKATANVETKTEEKAKEVKKAPVSRNDLRHPETGETARVSNNYRSLKRWLKEALVTEGLLEKVYSANELNNETNAKIKKALETIKTMPKYHA